MRNIYTEVKYGTGSLLTEASLESFKTRAPTLASFRAFQSLVVLGYNDSFRMDGLHDGMLNARMLQFIDGLWSGISLSLVSTLVRYFVILYIIVGRKFALRLSRDGHSNLFVLLILVELMIINV